MLSMRTTAVLSFAALFWKSLTATVPNPSLDLTYYQGTSSNVCSSGKTTTTIQNGTCVNVPGGFNSVTLGQLHNYPQNNPYGCLFATSNSPSCDNGGGNSGTVDDLVYLGVVEPSQSDYSDCRTTYGPASSGIPARYSTTMLLFCENVTPQSIIDELQDILVLLQNLVQLGKEWQLAIASATPSSRRRATVAELTARSESVTTARQNYLSAESTTRNRFTMAEYDIELANMNNQISPELNQEFFNELTEFNNANAAVVSGSLAAGDGVAVASLTKYMLSSVFTLDAFIAAYLAFTAGGGSGGQPPPTKTQPLSTPASTIYPPSPTCTPGGPIEVVVFTSTEATREDYEALKKSISPPAIIEDEVLYDSVNFRAFLVSLPNCTILTLLENPIVLTVSNNAAASVGNTATASAKTTRSKKVTEEAIQPRAIVPKRLVEQQQSPFHLNWLSALWNQQEQNGEFLAFEDFLYEDFTDHSNPAPIIYVVDTGAKPHNDFASRVTACFVAMNPRSSDCTKMDDTNGHGTQMMSLAGGSIVGVCKTCSLVPVKISIGSGTDRISTLIDVIAGFGFIADHVSENNAKGRAVINMSFGIYRETMRPNLGGSFVLTPAQFDPFPPLLDIMTNLGVVLVAAAGNDAARGQLIDTIEPQLSGGVGTPLTIVGAADYLSNRAEFSNFEGNGYGLVTLYANGVDVLCAGITDADSFIVASGSSHAAAQISGLMGHFLSDPSLRAEWQVGGYQDVSADAKIYALDQAKVKGRFADGVPRAALDVQISCSTNAPTLVTTPAYTTPTATQISNVITRTVATVVGTESSTSIIVAPSTLPSCVNAG